MPKVKMNEEFINTGLICPEGKKRIEYVADDLGGFFLEVRATSPGEGTYYLRVKNDKGSMASNKLGLTTNTTLEAARNKAVNLKSSINLGLLPPTKKATMTYSNYMLNNYLPFARSHKRSWKMDADFFRLRLDKNFGHLKLDKITRQSIQKFHVGLKQEENLAGASCDLYLQLLKRSLSLAVEDGLLDSNPAKSVKLFRDNNIKDRYMDETEMQRLMAALLKYRESNVSYVARIILSTGLRKNEVLKAKWSDID